MAGRNRPSKDAPPTASALAAAVGWAAESAVVCRAAAAALARRAALAAAALDGRLDADDAALSRPTAALFGVLGDACRLLKKAAARNQLHQALVAHKTAEQLAGMWTQVGVLSRTLHLGISTDDGEMAAAVTHDAADLAALVDHLIAAADVPQIPQLQQLETLLAINRHQSDLAAALPGHLHAPLAQLLSRTALAITATAGRGLSAPQDWSVDPDDVEIDRAARIGRGGFGDVFHGRWEGRDVAVKVLGAARGPDAAAAIEKEAAAWFPLHHPNVLRPWRVCVNADEPFIVMPLLCGDVKSFLAAHGDTGIDVRTGLLLGIARGMQYLHERQPPVVHGDLKANNVLIDKHGDVQIADFGLALIKESTSADTVRRGGALRWIAPERYSRGYKLARPYDVFAFAMTALQILTGQAPFADEPHAEAVAMWIRDGERPDRPAGIPDALWSVIVDSWSHDAAQRPSFREIVRRLEAQPTAGVPLERLRQSAGSAGVSSFAQSAGGSESTAHHDSGFAQSGPPKRDIEILLEVLPDWCARKGITIYNYRDFKESSIFFGKQHNVLGWDDKDRLIELLLVEDDIVGPLTPKISRLANLQTLVLWQKQITRIPESIGLLRQLRTLDIFATRITTIPESIGNLSKLSMLLLRYNQIDLLPDFFGNLKNLELLYINMNSIKELPKSIMQLSRLDQIVVGTNVIAELPSEPPGWKIITGLGLETNELKELPDWIGTLIKLEWIDLDDNHLETLPQSIGNLERLMRLLSNNRLKSVPDSICELRSLRRLLLNNNLLSSLPDNIGNMQMLAVLELNSNSIVELPASAARLTQLTVLTLERNNLTAFPDQIAHMTRLVKLNLSGNTIGEVPEWIGSLTMLAILCVVQSLVLVQAGTHGSADGESDAGRHLGKNRISRLPASIGALQRLTTLQLSQNWLGEVPDSVGGLRRLTKLLLDKNQLKTLPRSLRRLEDLTELRPTAALFGVLGDACRLLKKAAARNQLHQALVAHKTAEQLAGMWTQVGVLSRSLHLGISTDDGEMAAAAAHDAEDLATLVDHLIAAADVPQIPQLQQLETLLAINRHQSDLAAALPGHLHAPLAQLLSRTALAITATAGRGLSAPQDWSVDPDDVEIDRAARIGRGGFGDVFHGRWEGRDVAVKVLGAARGPDAAAAIEKEAAAWFPLHHPNVLRPWRPFIVMPLLCGDVKSFLAAHGDTGIDYLHERQPPVVHGDLKANNVLIDKHGDVQIADFGLALIKESTSADTVRRGGALRWVAPERYSRGYKLARPYDVFAFAMTALQILTGQAPFADEPHAEAVAMWIRDGERPDRPAGIPDALWSVIVDSWSHDAAQRPSFREIVRRLEAQPTAGVPLERLRQSAGSAGVSSFAQSAGGSESTTHHDSGFAQSGPPKRDIEILLEVLPEWCARKGITIDNYRDFKVSFFYANDMTNIVAWDEKDRLIELALVDNDIVVSLTPKISRLVNLKRLYVAQITKIPESIGLLRHLEYMVIWLSQATVIPESIGSLTKLTKLFLWCNRFASVPESFGNLRNLKVLFLGENVIKEFPKSLMQLKTLEYIGIYTNLITELPYEKLEWKNMISLELYDNQLKRIPELVSDLQRLEALELTDNHLETLPQSIGNLPRLFRIGLSNNRLKSLPDSICELRSLRRLQLDNNLLSSLPDNIGDMQALAVLELNSNSIAELPASAARLTQLTVLTLERNNLTAFPDQIAHMTRLVKLNLSGNFIGDVPEWIGGLTMLTMLCVVQSLVLVQAGTHGSADGESDAGRHLGKNRIARLPASIGALQRLTTLQLSQNWLGEVPDSVGGLRRLTKLLLDNNQLKTLPRSLRRLENLTELQLDGNMATADELRASMQRD
ncbi:U1 snRNP protein [Polyrhizophydium stewartii]|uniref:U1 snRNP protein n=1 Tax=Polyrhizophydium stewartii TaxID=2732419 RepID=A0ABR4N1R9_9FUNG